MIINEKMKVLFQTFLLSAFAFLVAKCNEFQEQRVNEKLSVFQVSTTQLKALKKTCYEQMLNGLRVSQDKLPMLPSYVTEFPTKNEVGSYLAVDLGGTNFRMAIVLFLREEYFYLDRSSMPIPEHLKVGERHEPLFEFMAKEVYSFLRKHFKKPKTIKMALTFSYPFYQTKLNEGILLRWAKGINLPSAVNLDIVAIFQSALNSAKIGDLNVIIEAIMNDTVAQVLAYKWVDGGISLSSIFGTGTNGGIILPVDEKTFSRSKLREYKQYKGRHMIFNTEWGSFFAPDQFPLTEYDEHVEANSNNCGFQRFEKLISGYYIAEIVIAFLAKEFPAIHGEWKESLTTEFLSKLADEDGKKGDNFNQVELIRKVSRAVIERCGALSAIPIVAGLEITGHKKEYAISVDGTLFEASALFRHSLKNALKNLLPDTTIRIVNDRNLSCTLLGAAVFVASKEQSECSK